MTKITELQDLIDAIPSDTIAVVDDPAGSPITKEITLSNLFRVITSLTAETAPAVGDELALFDTSGNTADKITLANMLKVVSALTELAAAPDPTADDILIIDGAAVPKYINATNLLKVVDGLAAIATGYASTDTLLTVDGGTPKKTTLANLFAGIEDFLAAITSGYAGADTLLTVDGGVAKYTTIANFFAGIEDALVELTTQPAKSDTFMVIDGGVAKHIKKRKIWVRHVQARLVVDDEALTVTDKVGSWFLHIPPDLNGLDLVYCHAEVDVAGVTGVQQFQIHNIDNAMDMLSTKLQIDTGETGSDTAATPYVINGSNDHVNTNDKLRIDSDVIQTTPAQGLTITLGFS